VKVPSRKINIAAGQTFSESSVWCVAPWVYKPISTLTAGWPTVVTAVGHGIPAGVTIPVWVANSRGVSIDTTVDAPWIAERASVDTLTLMGVNTGGQSGYVANSATASFMLPRDLTGFVARAQFRQRITGAVLVDAVSTGLTPQFALTAALGKIALTLTPAETRALLNGGTSETDGIAHVELVSPSGEVFRPWDYKWVVSPEGTRET